MSEKPPPTTTLKPINTQALVGHLGHLTPDQERALEEFKARLEKEGFYTPAKDGTATSHDDVTLVRFLRARKFDPAGAFAQFTSAEKWRKENNVDELYDTFDVAEFREAQKLYPQWTGRRDRTGLPVYVFKVGALSKKATDEYAKKQERLQPRMIALYEHMVQFVLPFCSSIPHKHQEVPISGCATIVDISNVSLMRFWQLKGHMQRASTLATANYAETLGAIYLVGAPNFFSTVWGWIGKWFDPGTVEKIFILPSHSVLSTLTTHIDPACIPTEFGGSLDWTYGSLSPNLDEPAKTTLGFDEVPGGPVRWIPEEGGLVVKGTGRLAEEVDKFAKAEQREVRKEEPVAAPSPSAPDANGSTEKSKLPPPVGMSGNATETEGPEDYDAETAARDHAGAPVKDLAATLEGTTL
ncbi:hypothetical protein JCM1841_006253 [Sporobolomyces salmonicolor]